MFVGPHKHIVCLIGNSEFSVSHFNNEYLDKVRKLQNLNISIVGLSSHKFANHIEDYTELT